MVSRRNIAALGALLLAACPSTEATRPSIDEVTAVTAIAPPSFDLLVKGHGFGLRDVSFDLSSGTGQASLYRSRLTLTNNMGIPPSQVRAITATVTSPTELHATVYLRDPLPQGEYGVELYLADQGEAAAARTPAFSVGSALVVADGGTIVMLGDDAAPRPDAPVRPNDDAGAPIPGEDAADPFADASDAPDTGLDPNDGGVGFFDASPIPDSGLGPFPVGPGFRRLLTLNNDTGVGSPVDLTVRIPVPHAAMRAAGQSRPDGLDLAVYLGTTQLPHQIEDLALLGTDRLELIVRLPLSIPPGPSTGIPLALTSDPSAQAITPGTDAVYIFGERFGNPNLGAVPTDPNRYNDRWEQACPDRITNAANGSKCRTDAEAGATRRSLATPRVLAMSNVVPMNETYEVVAYLAGSMQTQNDIVYFSYGPDNASFELTTLLPELAYDPAFRPNATLTFVETTNRNRTVTGWRLAAAGVPYTRMRVTFVPQIPTPNLHFRFISTDNQTNANTQVRLDDLVVRRALNPDFRVVVGPAEAR